MKEANPFQAFIDSRNFMCMAFVFLFAINIFINFGNTGFDQAFNYYLKAQLGLTSSYNGIIKAGVGFVSFIANMSLCIWIIKKTNVKKSMVVLTAFCALASIGTLISVKIGIFILFSILVYAAIPSASRFSRTWWQTRHRRSRRTSSWDSSTRPSHWEVLRVPDSGIYLFCECEASVCLHLRDLLGGRCGGVWISVLPQKEA